MMTRQNSVKGLVLLISIIEALIIAPWVSANCADSIASLELVQPAMQRLWARLQSQTIYPWGDERPYDQISGDRITLTAAFDLLTGLQKRQVLELLSIDYNSNWFDLLTPEEQETALQQPGIGAMSPYGVYASDGRAVSLPYNGCDRMTLLTEKDRYGWYYNLGIDAPLWLRNVGHPSWRQIRFPISAQSEKKVRLQFWQAIGYYQADKGWWIAWVPERGYFEINAPVNYQPKDLKKFWQIASTDYRYVVVDTQGTLRQD